MAAKNIMCAKLKQELPGLDESTPEGDQALKMALLVGGREMRDRVREHISAKAWSMWKDHMVMIFNEYRLDPMSDESNKVLKRHMEPFFFGEEQKIDNYVPPPR